MTIRETRPDGPDELRHHGGNINLARRRFPDAPEPWIDLSTGINPVPYPIGLVEPASWTRLPDAAAVVELEAVARLAYGAASGAEVIAVPGAQSLIEMLPRVLPARRVGVAGITYAEHETCWRAAGAEVVTGVEPGDLGAFDVGVVVNPNNPDGRLLPPEVLADLARSLARSGGCLIVDEAFMDACDPAASLVPQLPEAGAVVLRSFGKIYGLAGLRLGFAVAPPAIAPALRRSIGLWAVAGPAIDIGRRALADTSWRAEAAARLRRDAARLDRVLTGAGFKIVGGTPLFRLAARPGAGAWFERLARAGILTRPFHMRPDWLRFGIPCAADDWDRLEDVLKGTPGGTA